MVECLIDWGDAFVINSSAWIAAFGQAVNGYFSRRFNQIWQFG